MSVRGPEVMQCGVCSLSGTKNPVEGKETRLLSLWEHAHQAGALPRLPLEKQGFFPSLKEGRESSLCTETLVSQSMETDGFTLLGARFGWEVREEPRVGEKNPLRAWIPRSGIPRIQAHHSNT